MAFLGEKQSFSGLESTAAFDLALFCFPLQLSAVFGHSPASPAIFHSLLSSGLGQPGSSAGRNLWDERGAGGAGGAASPGHCLGGPGQPPRAAREGLSCPSACSSSFWQGKSQL